MIEVQAVLRNTVIRKDAVYVLKIESFDSDMGTRYTLIAYWGKWPVWIEHGISRLQSQEKASSLFLQAVINTMNEYLLRKLAKHYEVQEEYSQTPGWYVDQHGYILRRASSHDNVGQVIKPVTRQEPIEKTLEIKPQKPIDRWAFLEI